MSSILSTLNMSQQALLVNQAALNVVSNNISNMNTEGYSRQRVELSAAINYSPIGGNVYSQVNSAAGVQLDSITRYTNEYLTNYYREKNSDLSYLEQYAQIGSDLESIMNELNGTGLEIAFENFYEAAREVNNKPSDSVARLNFIQQAQTLSNIFNEKSVDLKELRESLVGDVNVPYSLDDSAANLKVIDANTLLEEIAKVNGEILTISAGDLQPNNLLDARDALINKLSQLIPIDVENNANGTTNVKINGVEIIVGNELKGKLSIEKGTEDTPAIVNLVNTEGQIVGQNINRFITSGELGAVLDAGSSRSDVLTPQSVLKELDKLASEFAKVMNDLQVGTGADGLTAMSIDKNTMQLIQSTESFFKTSDGSANVTAGNIKVNQALIDDPLLFAAARVDLADYDPNAVGNGNGILAMLETRTQTYTDITSTTFEGFVAKITGEVGLKSGNLTTDVKNQKLSVTQIKSNLDSSIGVNLDEEVVDLIKYQRAYEASARVFNVCNQLLDVLVNLGA